MATSGTVAQTQITVDDLLMHAMVRCGQPPERLTPEIAKIGRQNLYFYLSELANRGIMLWTIDYVLLGLKNLSPYLEMPAGTVDILNCLYRTMSRVASGSYTATSGIASYAFDGDVETACTQGAPLGNITMDALTPVTMATFGYLPNVSATLGLVWEYSDDGVTWSTAMTIATRAFVNNEWQWWDDPTPKTAQFWRVRATSGTINVREVFYSSSNYSRQIARINRDDYANLPNPNFGGDPTQFYYERLTPDQRLAVWPAPNNVFALVQAWRYRQVQDVGALTDTIEVPQRWINAIVCAMAASFAISVPGVDEARIARLRGDQEAATDLAMNEERDKSPIRWAPNIACYTR